MKELTTEKIEQLLADFELKSEENASKQSIKNDFLKEIDEYIEKKAVLGFDIYRYSQYPTLEQTLIPYLFKELYNLTILNCLACESFIFQNMTEESFNEHFIDAGDGGFQIFDSPFHAIVFAIYFQANIKRYNSGNNEPALLEIVGEITLRYSLTFDKIYSHRKNFYGPSIINNARIMAKDKLNRFLIDDNTVAWLTQEFNGIENLQIITFKEDFKNIRLFKDYKHEEDRVEKSLIFDSIDFKILKVDLLRIGEIKSKLDILSIHSLHIQTLMLSDDSSLFKKYTISLGNLNSTGITE